MKFWWVNHNQTYAQESSGGYIWSPTADMNGSRNQTYINLTLAEPGDIIFSYASAQIQAVGIIKSKFVEMARPPEFGSVGDAWSKVGWMVAVEWQKLTVPVSPMKFLERIMPLLPEKYSPLTKKGKGSQKCYLAALSPSLGRLVLGILRQFNSLPSKFLIDT